MLHWLRALLGQGVTDVQTLASDVDTLKTRVETLERSELDRETQTHAQLEMLSRYLKKMRQRDRRDGAAGADEETSEEAINRLIRERRRRPFMRNPDPE